MRKVVASSAGKKIIKDFIGRFGIKLLELITIAAQNAFPDEENKGKDLETEILRLGVKCILLFRDKDIDNQQFNELRPCLKELWNACLDYGGVLNFEYDWEKLIPVAEEFFIPLKNILLPHVSDNTIKALEQVYHTLFSKELLDYFFISEEYEEQRKIFVEILEKFYRF